MTSRRNSSGMPPTVAALLDTESHIARLTTHAKLLLQLQHKLEAALPRALASTVRVANYRLGKVVVHAANGAVAAKLRQVLPGLIENLGQTWKEVNEIEVKVQPLRPTLRQPKTEPLGVIGDKSKLALTSLSQKLPTDSPLRAALERLAAKK